MPAKPQLDARPPLKAAGTSPLIPPPAPDTEPRPREGGAPGWMTPVAIGSGVVAAGLLGVAIQQSGASKRSYSKAEDQLLPDGTFKDAEARNRWGSLRSEGSREHRNAVMSASGAAVFGATAVILGTTAAILHWKGLRSSGPDQVASLTIEF